MSLSLDVSPRSPLVLGDLTVECLGTIIPRFPYVVDGQVYPIGFTSYRMFTSRLNPDKQVRYTSQIVDSGDRPHFIVTASDDYENPISSYESPSACWRMVLEELMMDNFTDTSDHSASSKGKLSVSGRLRFGLTHPSVSSLIRDLPDYDKVLDMFGSMSPSSKRKYMSTSDDSADDSKMKAQRYGSPFSARNVNFASRDEMDDLESAVATLQALKYCSVY